MGQREFKSESMAMKLAGILGLRKFRWSLRRLHCPVSREALVLEVGAGGNPYPRANVMLDAMESTVERIEQQLINDRPLVLGLCEALPFKDKAFDFVIASHVLEHTDDPEKFLSELMRVGKAGYIETPEGWFEKMCPYTYHRLEVSNVDGKLLIRKKTSWKPEEVATLFESKLSKSQSWVAFLRGNPDLNHMRFYWQDTIKFEVVNPEADATWPYPPEVWERSAPLPRSLFFSIRDLYLVLRRWMYSQGRRNRSLDVTGLLRCPTCHSEYLANHLSSIVCESCSAIYIVSGGVPKLFPHSIEGFNRLRIEV